MISKQAKTRWGSGSHKRDESLVIVSGRGSLSLDMQNPRVLQGLFNSLNPKREAEIIRLQEEIKQLRSRKTQSTDSYGSYSVSVQV